MHRQLLTSLTTFLLVAFAAAQSSAQYFHHYKNKQKEITGIEYWGDADWLSAQQDPESKFHLLPKLRSLTLRQHRVTAAEMKYIVGLRNLTSLDVGNATRNLTDEGVEIEPADLTLVGQMTWLEELEISLLRKLGSDPHETVPIDWAFLAKLTRLQVLRTSDNHPWDDDFCAHIVRNSQLEALCSSAHGTVTDDGLAKLAALTHLQEFRMQSPNITDRGVAALVGLTAMENFTLGGKLTEKSIETIQHWRHLRQLSLDIDQISADKWKRLAALPRLEQLQLTAACDDDDLEVFRGHPTLRVLSLSKAEVTEYSLELFRSLPKLRFVYLSGSSQSKEISKRFEQEAAARD